MSKIEVTKIVFDTKTEQPELTLKDGTKRVIQLMPTGNCWVEYWVTPAQKAKSEREAKERHERDTKEAIERSKSSPKKPWWKL